MCCEITEYIEREAVINRIKEYALDVYDIDLDDTKQFSGGSRTENQCEGLYEATELIDDVPAADVAPVVHGRWDNVPNTYMSVMSKDGAYHGNATTCSVCHEVNPNAYKTNYCPNCGAKMDEKEKIK